MYRTSLSSWGVRLLWARKRRATDCSRHGLPGRGVWHISDSSILPGLRH